MSERFRVCCSLRGWYYFRKNTRRICKKCNLVLERFNVLNIKIIWRNDYSSKKKLSCWQTTHETIDYEVKLEKLRMHWFHKMRSFLRFDQFSYETCPKVIRSMLPSKWMTKEENGICVVQKAARSFLKKVNFC